METGKVKWFDGAKGYGFIVPDSGGADIYVHATEVENSGIKNLLDNTKVSYELKKHRRKMGAISLKIIE